MDRLLSKVNISRWTFGVGHLAADTHHFNVDSKIAFHGRYMRRSDSSIINGDDDEPEMLQSYH